MKNNENTKTDRQIDENSADFQETAIFKASTARAIAERDASHAGLPVYPQKKKKNIYIYIYELYMYMYEIPQYRENIQNIENIDSIYCTYNKDMKETLLSKTCTYSLQGLQMSWEMCDGL